MIKYQYLQPNDHEIQRQPKLKGLCITVATDLEKINDDFSFCSWTVAFKNPNDQFTKTAARDAIAQNDIKPFFGGQLKISNDYTRNEILSKILMLLCVNEVQYSSTYRKYIRHLICGNTFFDCFRSD
jgi:hypothetical protein